MLNQPHAPGPKVEPVLKQIPKPVPQKLIYASKSDIQFAQTALLKLGFNIGSVDGLWGPRCAKAIRQFEILNDLNSADGHLSELNLRWLERLTLLSRNRYENTQGEPKKKGISALLKAQKTSQQGPQLVIVEKEYKLFSRPNPYSPPLARLAPGTAVYIINKRDGWYEIESSGKKRGYLPAN